MLNKDYQMWRNGENCVQMVPFYWLLTSCEPLPKEKFSCMCLIRWCDNIAMCNHKLHPVKLI